MVFATGLTGASAGSCADDVPVGLEGLSAPGRRARSLRAVEDRDGHAVGLRARGARLGGRRWGAGRRRGPEGPWRLAALADRSAAAAPGAARRSRSRGRRRPPTTSATMTTIRAGAQVHGAHPTPGLAGAGPCLRRAHRAGPRRGRATPRLSHPTQPAHQHRVVGERLRACRRRDSAAGGSGRRRSRSARGSPAPWRRELPALPFEVQDLAGRGRRGSGVRRGSRGGDRVTGARLPSRGTDGSSTSGRTSDTVRKQARDRAVRASSDRGVETGDEA